MHILPGNYAGPIEKIQAKHNGDFRECKKALFIKYMNNGDRSWKTVIAALIKCGLDDLAEEIKQKLGLHMASSHVVCYNYYIHYYVCCTLFMDF